MDMFGDEIFGGMSSPFGGLGGFLSGMGGERRRGPTRGDDSVHKLKVTLEELYNGKVAKLQLSKNTICSDCGGVGGHGTVHPCGECHGRGITITVSQIGPGMVQQMQSKCISCAGEGETMAASDKCKTCAGRKVMPDTKLLEVTVEPGMRDDQRIVFRGEGNQLPGVEPGNVLIVIMEKSHPEFKREGHDLFIQKTVTLTEALCGFRSVITHLDGRNLIITHTPGEVLKPNSIRGISNEGMPVYQQAGEKGDLYISFVVDFPPNYFADEEKLKVLEKLLGGRPVAPPTLPEGAEEVNLSEVENTRGSRDGDDDDMEEHHGMGGHGPQVQCAQQ